MSTKESVTSVSRREFMRRAGSASALAMTVPGRLGAIAFFVDEAVAGFKPDLLPSADEVWGWQVWMAKLGPKYTGNKAHHEFVDFLAKNFQSTGLDLRRDKYTFPMWEARHWGITVAPTGGKRLDVPVASYYPYSGKTDRAGVTGPLIHAGVIPAMQRDFKWDLSSIDAKGKIVLVDYELGPTPYDEWWKPYGFYTPDTRYPNSINGTWTTRAPMLDEAKKAGARAVIFGHTALSDGHAAWQYAPFGRAFQDIPALWVGRDASARLRKIAGTDAPVTVTLEADVTPDTPTETLIATLPGQSDEVIIVNTHTDGPNATEENGALGLLALAKYFAKQPKESRKRTLVFVAVTGHFAGAYVPGGRGFIQQHPEIIKKAVAALTMEHLGSREWLDDASGKYASTGKDELTIVITQYDGTAKLMMESLQGTEDRRAVVVTPTPRGGFNGEGGGLSRAGIPTLGYIPIPSWLLAGPANCCIEKMSKTHLHNEIHVCAKVVQKMDSMPAAELKGSPIRTT